MFFRFPTLILSVLTFWLSARCSKVRFEHCTNARGAIVPSAQAEGAKSARSSHGRDLSRIRVRGFPLEYIDIQENSTRMLQPSCFAPMFACFVREPLSHHLNLAFGQRATGAISLQQRLSDFLAYSRPPTMKISSLTFVSACRLS